MTRRKYETVNEVWEVAYIIRDKLATAGESQAANDLTETLDSFWTTSSEALVELLDTFDEIKHVCNETLSKEDRSLRDDMLKGATRLLNLR